MEVILGRLCEGFLLNFKLFGLTLLFSLPLGLVIAFGSMSRFKPLAWLVKIFVWIIRGTPLLLQLLIIFLGPGLMGALAVAGEGGDYLAVGVEYHIDDVDHNAHAHGCFRITGGAKDGAENDGGCPKQHGGIENEEILGRNVQSGHSGC